MDTILPIFAEFGIPGLVIGFASSGSSGLTIYKERDAMKLVVVVGHNSALSGNVGIRVTGAASENVRWAASYKFPQTLW